MDLNFDSRPESLSDSSGPRCEPFLQRIFQLIRYQGPKALLLDNDGVVVNSEPLFHAGIADFFEETFGGTQFRKIQILGSNYHRVYEQAVSLGTITSFERYLECAYEFTQRVYASAPITEGMRDFMVAAHSSGFKVGIVSSARESGLTIVKDRLALGFELDCMLGLTDRIGIRNKPEPDGYLEALKMLKVLPQNAIIIEDSKTGLQSAERALRQNLSARQHGIVVGLRENLLPGALDPRLPPNPASPDISLDNLRELLDLFHAAKD